MKNKGISLVIFALLNVVLWSQLGASSAGAVVVRIPGVAPGDWARYNVAFEFTSNDPHPPVTPPPPEIADMEYYQLLVLSVASSNVTFELTIRFKNGTQTSSSMQADVANEYPAGPPYLLIAANLTAGDTLFLSPSSPTINATLLRTYAGSEREVNLLSLVQNTTGPFGYSGTGRISMYWDRASGIVDEIVYEINYTKLPEGYETYALLRMAMRETGIWNPTYIHAQIVVCPKCLNLRSSGKWITVFISLPKAHDVRKVDVSSIALNDSVHGEKTLVLSHIGRRLELAVKFDRQAIIELILKSSRHNRGLETATLTVTGRLKDGTAFQGSDRIIIIHGMPGIRQLPEWCQSPR